MEFGLKKCYNCYQIFLYNEHRECSIIEFVIDKIKTKTAKEEDELLLQIKLTWSCVLKSGGTKI